MDQAALLAAEAQFMAAVRAYVATLVKQTILEDGPPNSDDTKDMLIKPGNPRFGRDDNSPGNR
jgi:hypothetical protein